MIHTTTIFFVVMYKRCQTILFIVYESLYHSHPVVKLNFKMFSHEISGQTAAALPSSIYCDSKIRGRTFYASFVMWSIMAAESTGDPSNNGELTNPPGFPLKLT